MRRAAKVALVAIPAAILVAVFFLPVIGQSEDLGSRNTCTPACQDDFVIEYPAWVSPSYAYLGYGAVYVANVNDTAHIYCWHAGNPNMVEEPGNPARVCGVPMVWDTVPAPLWPNTTTYVIGSRPMI